MRSRKEPYSLQKSTASSSSVTIIPSFLSSVTIIPSFFGFLFIRSCSPSKLNGFHLHVTRALSAGVEPPPPPPDYVSTSANTIAETPSLNGPVSPSSLAITKAGPLELTSSTLLERAADEGFAIIQSPKVGFFRRSRTIKGKRAPPACKEKQVVKEGQVICYIEQLGGEIPVESDVSGEITKILCKEGEPVGYGDAIIAILPSFPGIKKLS